MQDPRRSSIVLEVPNLDTTDNALAPMIFGNVRETEILDRATDTWSPYRELPDNTWVSTGCVVAYRGKIYKIFNTLQILDPADFSIQDLGEVPDAFGIPGRCASLEIDGRPGRNKIKEVL